MNRLQVIAIASLLASLSSCAYIPHDPSFASLTGTITYRQRVALLPEAVVLVQLVDTSRPDANVDIVAEERIEKPGQVPVKFDLKYDQNSIISGHHYAVMAAIYQGRRLIFDTQTSVPALTARGSSSVDVVLEPVAHPG